MFRTPVLEFLDRLVREGKITFTLGDLRRALALSPQAGSNVCSRLVRDGLIDRTSYGHFVIRPLGSLGTRAGAEDTALAVGSLLAGEPHRIAYRSALAHHDLIRHPARVIQVAAPRIVQRDQLSGRPLQMVSESRETVGVGAVDAGWGARVSDLERALLDAARRPGLVGGLDAVAEALSTGRRDVDPVRLRGYARVPSLSAAGRRLASVARRLRFALVAETLTDLPAASAPIAAFPGQRKPVVWRDSVHGVVWSSTALDIVDAQRPT
jgi:predicted transcriptional regulator of viral defense system